MRKAWMLFLVLPLMAADCESNDADRVQEEETQQIATEAHRQLGMPDITNFTERRFMKQIFELRDRETTTHTYVVDLTGNLHYLCQSVGYGLPYSTQYTNPERKDEGRWGNVTLPQPDPNGLFMPTSATATWVLCLDESDGDIDPLYVEPLIIVTPFRLAAEGGSYFIASEQAAQVTEGIE